MNFILSPGIIVSRAHGGTGVLEAFLCLFSSFFVQKKADKNCFTFKFLNYGSLSSCSR